MEAKTYNIEYARILRPGIGAAKEDAKVFNSYTKGNITLRECFEQFIKNSLGCVDEHYWDEQQFRFWLRTLGYFSAKN